MKNNFKDLTEKEIDSQENLSEKRFSMLKPKYESDFSSRPEANLIELMHWAKESFAKDLKSNTKDLKTYIHNKIIIDGSFLQFAEESKVKVTCLISDSISSWRSENDNEHFIAQGVFLIKREDTEFILCSLFHKGNQNEDEVSFFTMVPDEKFEAYKNFRNEFDDWITKRDREHLEIHVVGGDGHSYDRDNKWQDLYLPEGLKRDIQDSVEGFLKAESYYKEANIAWKRGMLFYGEPGLGKSSTIRTIISSYDFKPVTVQSGAQTNDDVLTEAFAYAQEQSPGLLYIEDLDSILTSGFVSLSHFLNLMDGVATKSGILIIATANDIGKLGESVVNRPSRFDRKFEFPLPDEDMTRDYLKKWFNKSLKKKEYDKLVELACENNFSYAYLKELYLTSIFNAISEDRKKPNFEDVNKAIEQLTSDKEIADNNFEKTTGIIGV